MSALDAFLIPIPSGMTETVEGAGNGLSPERDRALAERLRELQVAQGRALVASMSYYVR